MTKEVELIKNFCWDSTINNFKKLSEYSQIMLYKYAMYVIFMDTNNIELATLIEKYYSDIADTLKDYNCIGNECTVVFVYGTLLKKFHNHHYIEPAVYLGQAKTVEKYTMYIDDTIPNVTKIPSYNIEGEVYLIKPTDIETIRRVDDLEAGYMREEIGIKLGDKKITAFMYFGEDTIGDLNISGSYTEYIRNKKDEMKKITKKRDNDKVWYFAYGSNMDRNQFENRLQKHGHNFSRQLGVLKNYKLVFNKTASVDRKEGYANIEISDGDVVEGVLYRVTLDDLKIIDRYEGYDENSEMEDDNEYNRVKVKIYLSNGKSAVAYVYEANPWRIDQTIDFKPSRRYVRLLLGGQDILSKKYFKRLQNLYCSDNVLG